MPVWPLHVMLSLLAGALAIAGLNLAFPGEIVRAIGGVPFPALLASLPGMAATVRGLPLLAASTMQWAMARHVALALNAALAALSVPSLIRLLKWAAGAS